MTGHRAVLALFLAASLPLAGCATLDDDRPVVRDAGGGWYGGFYYPGRGFQVYDKWGRSRQWHPHERVYWTTQRKRDEAKKS